MEHMIKERYGIADQDYQVMEVMVLKGAPHYAGKQWKFAGAFYYATTVLTTIGKLNEQLPQVISLASGNCPL